MLDVFINEGFYKYYQRYPVTLVDIGASNGLKDIWQNMGEFLHVIGFEPDEEEYNNLVKNKSNNQKYFNTALYREKTTIDFHVTRKRQLSSIFLPDRDTIDKFPEKERFDVLKSVKIATDTLDSQLREDKNIDIDFIKIDTQGSELLILEGATDTLVNVIGLEVEVEFRAIYKNQPLFSDVDNFLRDSGFHLFDLRPWYWKRNAGKQYGMPKGQLIFADALYLKESRNIQGVLNGKKSDDLKKAKLLKAISISILFGYIDYAFELFELEQGMFNEQETDLFNNFFQRSTLWRSGGKVLGNLEYIEEA